MKKDNLLEFENNEIEFLVRDQVGVLTFKKTAFEGLANLEVSGNLLYLLNWIEKDKNVNVLLLKNDPEAFSEVAYENFLQNILKKDENNQLTSMVESDKRLVRARQLNTFRSMIMKMLEFQKTLIFALQGTVVTPFFGTALSTDFRIASEDMKFSLEHVKYGLHPSGALPYLLPRFIGRSKTLKYLFKGGTISAEEAMELRIVEEIVPNGDFDDYVFDKALGYAKLDENLVKVTKKLMFNFKSELDRYFDMESKLLGF